MKLFREQLSTAKNILILSGSGISAESGVPTFRGSGGFWKTYQVNNLATPEAFASNPALVWEFYEYRRTLVHRLRPNKAHKAIAEFQNKLKLEGRNVTILTQNVDGLHQKAGSNNIVELHGSLFKTRCTKCKDIAFNDEIPICPALHQRIESDPNAEPDIKVEDLPRCQKNKCGALLRPDVVWFGETLEPEILEAAEEAVQSCDACLIIGTSSLIYPAAMFAPTVARRGIPVAEFNLEATPVTKIFQYHFRGPCTKTVPEALEI